MLGPCAGGATHSPALTDFVFMVRGIAQMYLTGPDVVRSVTGEEVSHEQLGGADAHAGVSGVAGFVYDTEEDCLADVRHLLSMLPANNREPPPADDRDRDCRALLDLVPGDPNRAYDMRAVIEEIVDDDLFETHASWAPNVLCGLARLDGHVVAGRGEPARGPGRRAGHPRLGMAAPTS